MLYSCTSHRFVSEEDQKQSLLKENTDLQQRIRELESGLQELGREYQTLQLVQSRQSERKWESDKDAVNCFSCSKKFTVSVRKVGSLSTSLPLFS